MAQEALVNRDVELSVLLGFFYDEEVGGADFLVKAISLFGTSEPGAEQIKESRKLFADPTCLDIYDALTRAMAKTRPGAVILPEAIMDELGARADGRVLLTMGEGDEYADVIFSRDLPQAVSFPKRFSSAVAMLRDLSSRRQMVDMLSSLESSIESLEPLDDLSERLDALYKLSLSSREIKLETAADKMNRIRNAPKNASVIRTGLTELDELIGGFEGGRIYMFGARPKVGKTLVSVNFALAAMEQGAYVLFVAAEMQAREMMSRLISSHSMTPQSLVWGECFAKNKTPQEMLAADPEFERAAESADAIEAYSRLFIMAADDEGDNMLPPDIMARITAVSDMAKNEGRPFLVIVDYLQLLIRDRSRTVELTATLSNALKRLATATGAAIVVNSQLNRTGADTEPKSWMLKDSSALEQDADVICMLDRPSQRDEDLPQNLMTMIVEMSRYSGSGRVKVNYIGSCGALSDWVGDEPSGSSRGAGGDDEELE